MAFATQYEGTLNSDGSTSSIEENQPVVTTPSVTGSSSSGGGSSSIVISTDEDDTTPIQQIKVKTTKISEEKVTSEQEGNFFSEIKDDMTNLFGLSSQNQITGAAIGTNNNGNWVYLAMIFAFIFGIVITIIVMKVRKRP